MASKLGACANYNVNPFVLIVYKTINGPSRKGSGRDSISITIYFFMSQLPNIPLFRCLPTNRLLVDSFCVCPEQVLQPE